MEWKKLWRIPYREGRQGYFGWVERGRNKRADKLCNRALDGDEVDEWYGDGLSALLRELARGGVKWIQGEFDAGFCFLDL